MVSDERYGKVRVIVEAFRSKLPVSLRGYMHLPIAVNVASKRITILFYYIKLASSIVDEN